MKKKLLAVLCALSVLIGVLALSATAESTTTAEKFYVGYAKVDINPYIDKTDPTKGLMALPLRGLGSPEKRLSKNKINDNGDYEKNADGTYKLDENNNRIPIIDENDGLFLTCIAISNTPYDANNPDSYKDAILLFTMDSIGDMNHTKLARNVIQKKFGIQNDHVMVSGTHAHSGVDLTVLTSDLYDEQPAVFADLNEWKCRLVGYTREPKLDTNNNVIRDKDGHVTFEDKYLDNEGNLLYEDNYFLNAAGKALSDLTEATIKKGQIEVDQSTAASGKPMNFVRHYVAKDGSNGYNYVMDSYSNQYNPSYDNVSYEGHVSEADQTLHTISFEFAAKDPIVLVNWRNHPQFSSSADRYAVSSDYINAFRYKMEQSGYRPAFFQGTGGNTQPTSRISQSYDANGEVVNEQWVENESLGGADANLEQGHIYGQLLADVTLECLENLESVAPVTTGKVQTMQNIYAANRVTYSEHHYDAAVAALAAVKEGSWPLKEPLYDKYGNVLRDDEGNVRYRTKADPFQHKYTDVNGKEHTICISCEDQATKIKTHYENQTARTIDIEIDTILIGPNIAIVTCPGEPFDRYSLQAAADIKKLWNDGDGKPVTLQQYNEIANQYNDWDNLKTDSYGEPLIFGYSNQHVTYIPNALAYNYNAEHPELYSTNSYGSFMTPLAEGEGERMVANMAVMLDLMVNGEKKHCDVCNKDVLWYPLNNVGINSGYDHYYLSGDMTILRQLTIPESTTVCVDLNGHNLTNTYDRVFDVAANATLNIVDSSTGKIKGTAPGGTSGGVISTETGSTVNIYGGTLSCTGNTYYGGVIWAKGTVNIYGGTIEAGDSSRCGDAICLHDTGAKLNACGGTITKNTDCVGFRNSIGTVQVGGNAVIGEIDYSTHPNATTVNTVAPTKETFKIVDSRVDNDAQTPFTGSVVLKVNNQFTHGKQIGSAEVLIGQGASVTISSGYDVEMDKDKKLFAMQAVGGEAGVVTEDSALEDITPDDITSYSTLAEAIAKVGDGYVILGADVEDLTVSSDLTIDLNGRNITNLTVENNATVKLKDRKTIDCFIGDQVYGVVETISGDGNVVAADNYLAVTDTEGTSYHCYKMKLTKVGLRSAKCGIYYKGEFDGDAKVVSQIENFGIALRIGKAPDASSMKPGTYSAFTPEEFGGESRSTVLVDILKSSNILSTNQHNANLLVYGSPYIKLTNDRGYLFADYSAYSLKTFMEQYSAENNTVAKLKADDNFVYLMEMYRKFSAVMTDWKIQSIRNAYEGN